MSNKLNAPDLAPEVVLAIAKSELPCFIYDSAVVRKRAALARSLVDQLFFPIKACPEPEVVRAALRAGCGLDLCSAGDLEIALAANCPGKHWKFTSPCADEHLLSNLCREGARLDADSLEQALAWGRCGGKACGLRIRPRNPAALYGAKFGIAAVELPSAIVCLEEAGVVWEGLHLHDLYAHVTPAEFAARLGDSLLDVGSDILRRCNYINIGGSWPMKFSHPAPVEDLAVSLTRLRERLADTGFTGRLCAEPGRWIVGPCGYWAARVIAVKSPPTRDDYELVILDTSTPVPNRPSLRPFAVLREGKEVKEPRNQTYQLFGSANTALDLIGEDVRLPVLEPGDVVVSFGQGAYTRSLIAPFNERTRPGAVVVGL